VKYDPEQFILYMTLTQAWFGNGLIAWNAVSWSISAELVAYMFFPVLLYLLRGRPLQGASVVLLILGVAMLSANIFTNQELTRLASQISWLRSVPSFVAGIWLARHAALIAQLGRLKAQVLLYGGAALLAMKLAFGLPEMLGLSAAWTIVAAAYSCDLQEVRTLPSLPWISNQGRLTYSLYLIHPVVSTVWMSFLAPRLLGFLFHSMWVALIIGFIMTFVLSHHYFVYFEEPLRKFFGRPLFFRQCSRALEQG
jgi:peptidoglycan/LPS O-acetylase OafA/YrhL